MNLFENLKEYILGITITNGICIVAIKIKPEWVIPPSNLVGVDINQKTNTTSLYGIDPSITLDTLLEQLDIIVRTGKENEEKKELFNLKIKELDNLFSNNSLEKLKTLSFIFNQYQDLEKNKENHSEHSQYPLVVNEIESVIEDSMAEKQEIIFDPMSEDNVQSFNEMSNYEDMTLSEITVLKKG